MLSAGLQLPGHFAFGRVQKSHDLLFRWPIEVNRLSEPYLVPPTRGQSSESTHLRESALVRGCNLAAHFAPPRSMTSHSRAPGLLGTDLRLTAEIPHEDRVTLIGAGAAGEPGGEDPVVRIDRDAAGGGITEGGEDQPIVSEAAVG